MGLKVTLSVLNPELYAKFISTTEKTYGKRTRLIDRPIDTAYTDPDFRSKKHKTLSREANLTQMINDFDSKSASDKVASLHYFILDVGTYTSGKLDPIFFDQLPPLTEVDLNPEVEPIISEKHFLDATSIVQQIEVPSFLDPPSLRDCPRKLRSSRAKSRVHPFK